jgi:hypothetical protein
MASSGSFVRRTSPASLRVSSRSLSALRCKKSAITAKVPIRITLVQATQRLDRGAEHGAARGDSIADSFDEHASSVPFVAHAPHEALALQPVDEVGEPITLVCLTGVAAARRGGGRRGRRTYLEGGAAVRGGNC